MYSATRTGVPVSCARSPALPRTYVSRLMASDVPVGVQVERHQVRAADNRTQSTNNNLC